MSFSDVEHLSNMLSGCEALDSHFTDKAPVTTEARYAFSVLKLHAGDVGCVAGTEGFLDNVKAGAKKSADWIKKLFEAIKQWFATAFKSTRAKFKSLFSGNDEEKEKQAKAIRSGTIARVKSIKSASEATPDGVDGKEVGSTADKLIDALEKGVPAGIALSMDSFLSAIDKLEGKYVSYVGSKAPKGEESHAEYQKAVKAFKSFSTPVNALTVYVNELASKK